MREFFQNFFPKRTKNDVFVLNKVKMDQKGHITDQKGLKMYEKRQKMEFSDLKYLLFSRIFLSGIGGYTPSPLTENHPAQKRERVTCMHNVVQLAQLEDAYQGGENLQIVL